MFTASVGLKQRKLKINSDVNFCKHQKTAPLDWGAGSTGEMWEKIQHLYRYKVKNTKCVVGFYYMLPDTYNNIFIVVDSIQSDLFLMF